MTDRRKNNDFVSDSVLKQVLDELNRNEPRDVMFSDDGHTLIKYLPSLTAKEYVIPDGVTKIAEYAFWRCDNLKRIVIPKSITKISKGAFCNCKNLKSVVIPDGVTKIDDGVFCGCENLDSVTIPASVTAIEERLLQGV